MRETEQEKLWKSDFGTAYLFRNFYPPSLLDHRYTQNWGTSRSSMNDEFIPKDVNKILEVGCGDGNQLFLLQKSGYENLYGLELYPRAIEEAYYLYRKLNIIQGTVFDIPFKDGYFDYVFTSGLLIHIHPKDLSRAMKEVYRVSNKYIAGFEYFNEKQEEIEYRGHKNICWKNDFAILYTKQFPKLRLLKERKYKYTKNENRDTMFLLEKDA